MTLDDIRGKHAGQCAVIMGSGPSLRFADERIGQGRVTIAVNDAITKFPSADYYISMDASMSSRRHWKSVVSGKVTCVLKQASSWNAHGGFDDLVGQGKPLSSDRVVLVPWRQDGPNNARSFRVTQDDKDFIVGGSSAHSAVNLAAVLGCRAVCLIGCDCQLDDDGRRYYWQYEGQEQYVGGMVSDDPAKAIASREAVQDIELVKYVGACWRTLREVNPELTIVDVSGGALTDLLESADIDEFQS